MTAKRIGWNWQAEDHQPIRMDTFPSEAARPLLVLFFCLAGAATAAPAERPLDPSRWPEARVEGQWQRVWISPERVLDCRVDQARIERVESLIGGRGPVRMAFGKSGSVTLHLDFGRELFGNIEFALESTAPVHVSFRCSESPNWQQAAPPHQVDLPAGKHIWESKPAQGDYGLYAVRFLDLTVSAADAEVTLQRVRCHFRARAVRWVGSFACSDPILTRAWEIGVYTARLAMQDLYWCDIKRERMVWGGDLELQALGSYAGLDERDLLWETLRRCWQGVPKGPTGIPTRPIDNIPACSASWVLAIRDYWMHTGRRDFLAEMEPAVEKMMSWFDSFYEKEIGLLGYQKGFWYHFGHQIPYAKGYVTHINCLYHECLRAARDLAIAAGKPEVAARHEERAAVVKRAVNTLLWAERPGAYVDWVLEPDQRNDVFHLASNGTALLADIADDRRAEQATAAVLTNPYLMQPRDAYPIFFIVWGLLERGFARDALDRFNRFWGRMAAQPEVTTFWEYWNPHQPDGVWVQIAGLESCCHAWGGSASYLLSKYFLGLRPAEAGFSVVGVMPSPGPLEWVAGAMPTPLGLARAEVRREGAADLRITAETPGTARARIGVPREATEIQDITLNGKPVYAKGRFVARPDLVRSGWTTNGFVLFETQGGGRFELVATRKAKGEQGPVCPAVRPNWEWSQPVMPLDAAWKGQKVVFGPPQSAARTWVRHWVIAAPFQVGGGTRLGMYFEQSLDHPFLPEEAALALKPGQKAGACTAFAFHEEAPNGVVSLDRWFANLDFACAYAVAYLWSDRRIGGVRLRTGADDYIRAYVNGRKVLSAADRLRGTVADDDTSDLFDLKEGWNIIVAKVIDFQGDWSFCLRLADESGQPVGLEECPPPGPEH